MARISLEDTIVTTTENDMNTPLAGVAEPADIGTAQDEAERPSRCSRLGMDNRHERRRLGRNGTGRAPARDAHLDRRAFRLRDTPRAYEVDGATRRELAHAVAMAAPMLREDDILRLRCHLRGRICRIAQAIELLGDEDRVWTALYGLIGRQLLRFRHDRRLTALSWVSVSR